MSPIAACRSRPFPFSWSPPLTPLSEEMLLLTECERDLRRARWKWLAATAIGDRPLAADLGVWRTVFAESEKISGESVE